MAPAPAAPLVPGPGAPSRATAAGTWSAFQKFWGRWSELRFGPGAAESRPTLGGLSLSPVGLGTHHMDRSGEDLEAIKSALSRGINVVDTAPNYAHAEETVGRALRETILSGRVAREGVVLISKVGNVVGEEAIRRCRRVLAAAGPGAGVASDAMLPQRADGSIFHCMSPAWIDAEIRESLRRLQVDTVDVVLLHNPETRAQLRGAFSDAGPSDAAGASAQHDFYEVHLRAAFQELERQVGLGHIQYYGVSAAFYPLRKSEPQHLVFDRVLSVAGPHFRALQTPLNFAEPHLLTAPHAERLPDGRFVRAPGQTADELMQQGTLEQKARARGCYLITNRPLNGLYKELQGVCRFASHPIPFNSELDGGDVDQLESKLSKHMVVPGQAAGAGAAGGDAPGDGGDAGDDDFDPGVTDQLAAKTILCLVSLQLGTVLCGLRTREYLDSVWGALFRAPSGESPGLSMRPPARATAEAAVRDAHRSLSMWFSMAAEADHGTAKDWRLPPRPEASKL